MAVVETLPFAPMAPPPSPRHKKQQAKSQDLKGGSNHLEACQRPSYLQVRDLLVKYVPSSNSSASASVGNSVATLAAVEAPEAEPATPAAAVLSSSGNHSSLHHSSSMGVSKSMPASRHLARDANRNSKSPQLPPRKVGGPLRSSPSKPAWRAGAMAPTKSAAALLEGRVGSPLKSKSRRVRGGAAMTATNTTASMAMDQEVSRRTVPGERSFADAFAAMSGRQRRDEDDADNDEEEEGGEEDEAEGDAASMKPAATMPTLLLRRVDSSKVIDALAEQEVVAALTPRFRSQDTLPAEPEQAPKQEVSDRDKSKATDKEEGGEAQNEEEQDRDGDPSESKVVSTPFGLGALLPTHRADKVKVVKMSWCQAYLSPDCVDTSRLAVLERQLQSLQSSLNLLVADLPRMALREMRAGRTKRCSGHSKRLRSKANKYNESELSDSDEQGQPMKRTLVVQGVRMIQSLMSWLVKAAKRPEPKQHRSTLLNIAIVLSGLVRTRAEHGRLAGTALDLQLEAEKHAAGSVRIHLGLLERLLPSHETASVGGPPVPQLPGLQVLTQPERPQPETKVLQQLHQQRQILQQHLALQPRQQQQLQPELQTNRSQEEHTAAHLSGPALTTKGNTGLATACPTAVSSGVGMHVGGRVDTAELVSTSCCSGSVSGSGSGPSSLSATPGMTALMPNPTLMPLQLPLGQNIPTATATATCTVRRAASLSRIASLPTTLSQWSTATPTTTNNNSNSNNSNNSATPAATTMPPTFNIPPRGASPVPSRTTSKVPIFSGQSPMPTISSHAYTSSSSPSTTTYVSQSSTHPNPRQPVLSSGSSRQLRATASVAYSSSGGAATESAAHHTRSPSPPLPGTLYRGVSPMPRTKSPLQPGRVASKSAVMTTVSTSSPTPVGTAPASDVPAPATAAANRASGPVPQFLQGFAGRSFGLEETCQQWREVLRRVVPSPDQQQGQQQQHEQRQQPQHQPAHFATPALQRYESFSPLRPRTDFALQHTGHDQRQFSSTTAAGNLVPVLTATPVPNAASGMSTPVRVGRHPGTASPMPGGRQPVMVCRSPSPMARLLPSSSTPQLQPHPQQQTFGGSVASRLVSSSSSSQLPVAHVMTSSGGVVTATAASTTPGPAPQHSCASPMPARTISRSASGIGPRTPVRFPTWSHAQAPSPGVQVCRYSSECDDLPTAASAALSLPDQEQHGRWPSTSKTQQHAGDMALPSSPGGVATAKQSEASPLVATPLVMARGLQQHQQHQHQQQYMNPVGTNGQPATLVRFYSAAAGAAAAATAAASAATAAATTAVAVASPLHPQQANGAPSLPRQASTPMIRRVVNGPTASPSPSPTYGGMRGGSGIYGGSMTVPISAYPVESPVATMHSRVEAWPHQPWESGTPASASGSGSASTSSRRVADAAAAAQAANLAAREAAALSQRQGLGRPPTTLVLPPPERPEGLCSADRFHKSSDGGPGRLSGHASSGSGMGGMGGMGTPLGALQTRSLLLGGAAVEHGNRVCVQALPCSDREAVGSPSPRSPCSELPQPHQPPRQLQSSHAHPLGGVSGGYSFGNLLRPPAPSDLGGLSGETTGVPSRSSSLETEYNGVV